MHIFDHICNLFFTLSGISLYVHTTITLSFLSLIYILTVLVIIMDKMAINIQVSLKKCIIRKECQEYRECWQCLTGNKLAVLKL